MSEEPANTNIFTYVAPDSEPSVLKWECDHNIFVVGIPPGGYDSWPEYMAANPHPPEPK